MVSPETTVYVRAAGGGGGGAGAGSGSGAGAGASSAAASTTSGAGGWAAGGGGGASVSVLDDHAGPSNPYSTRLRSSCRSSRTSFAPLVSVAHTGLSCV